MLYVDHINCQKYSKNKALSSLEWVELKSWLITSLPQRTHESLSSGGPKNSMSGEGLTLCCDGGPQCPGSGATMQGHQALGLPLALNIALVLGGVYCDWSGVMVFVKDVMIVV